MEDPRYEKFITYLKKLSTTSWHRRMGTMAQEAGISQGYLSRIINGKNIAPYNIQVEIAKACGYTYDQFLQLGQDMVQVENVRRAKAKRFACTGDASLMSKDDVVQSLQKIIQDDIETLNLHYMHERRMFKRTISELREDLDRELEAHDSTKVELGEELEREREVYGHTIAELREDYNELKAEAKELKAEIKELRLENKQLLEQHQALQQKNT